MHTLNVAYANFKALVVDLPVAYVVLGERVQLLTITDEFYAMTFASTVDEIADFVATLKPTAKEAPTEDDARLLVFLASGKPRLAPRTAGGVLRATSEKPDGSRKSFYTHDWTDSTTWYTASVRVVNEIAIDMGSHLTYGLGHNYLIDTYHGKLTGEDFLIDGDGHNYRIGVTVNGVSVLEKDPHDGVGDYTVDYEAARITFEVARAEADVVAVTYHYANGSLFRVKPGSGKRLAIDMAEVQLSVDVVVNDTMIYDMLGYVDVFAPELLEANGGPLAPGTLISLGQLRYKSVQDYMNDSLRAYPQYPALSAGTWRGISQATTVFDWDYVRGITLDSAAGMEIQIKLEHNTKFGGAFATATMYGSEENR